MKFRIIRSFAAGPDQVGSAGAYQIYLEGTDSEGVSNEVVIMAVQGHDFGAISHREPPKGTKPAEAEIHPCPSFRARCAGGTYKMYMATSGVKVLWTIPWQQDAWWTRLLPERPERGRIGNENPTDAAMETGFGSVWRTAGL